tara:strand:+ start:91 stop:714 length:624 start_codon:yes stop_codon:yes gene_type:complete
MPKKGKFSFMLGNTRVTPQDLGITEALSGFDQRIGKGVYERDLPSRAVGLIPGKFGFNVFNPMSPTGNTQVRFADLGFTERLGQMFGIDPMETRGQDEGFQDALETLRMQDKESGRYNTSFLGNPFSSLFGGTSQARQTPAGMLGYDDFIRDTRNSPAMQSGAFDPKDLYETYKRNQQFKADRKSGKLRKDRMAGDRIRITMPMDLE